MGSIGVIGAGRAARGEVRRRGRTGCVRAQLREAARTVCSDQGIPETKKLFNLARQLDAMVRQLGVPWPLVDQAHLVCDHRNIGSHDGGLEVREADVPPIRGFG